MDEEKTHHCWMDVIPTGDQDVYSSFFHREVKRVGPNPALIAVAEINRKYPGACGDFAWNAIAPTQRLFAAGRAAGVPVIYTTANSNNRVVATNRDRRGIKIPADSVMHVDEIIVALNKEGGQPDRAAAE